MAAAAALLQVVTEPEVTRSGRNPRRDTRRETARSLRRKYRRVFAEVLQSYCELRSALGGAGDARVFRLVEYKADVERAMEATLSKMELAYLQSLLRKADELDLTRQSTAFLRISECLGKTFLGRGLWPLHNYFNGGHADAQPAKPKWSNSDEND